MKKILLSVSALLAFSVMSAQEETPTTGFSKGDAFISGTVGFSTQKQGDVKNNSFTVAPSVGYFVSENIALGVSILYTQSKYNIDDVANSESTTSTFNPSLFGRYYFTPASKFSVFGHLQAGYVSGKTESNGGGEYKNDGFNAMAGAGLNYFISDHLALETVFGAINYSSYKYDGGQKNSNFGINLNLSNVYLGLVYKF